MAPAMMPSLFLVAIVEVTPECFEFFPEIQRGSYIRPQGNEDLVQMNIGRAVNANFYVRDGLTGNAHPGGKLSLCQKARHSH